MIIDFMNMLFHHDAHEAALLFIFSLSRIAI
jgi:hypothetical protein